ncbi:MAG: aminotransferase class I/II-fold pyridoxal phosphate-dependent enzyme [Nanoarchaeota archaeon]
MKIRFFNPGLGYQKIKDEVLSEVDRVLSAGDLILRKDVEEFEKSVAEYIGVKYCVALNSCTDALYLALRGLKIGPGDEVLVPSRTFVASAQVIVQVGATPVFYDLDGADILYKYNYPENVKAIIPVHIEGAFDNNFERILDCAKERGWHIIEDAAQSFGATQNGKKAGAFGIAGCFSFYPAKIFGSLLGDAGALVTNDRKLYNWVKGARNHFKETAEDWGINSRLDNPAAACLNLKFKYLLQILMRRQEIAKMYLNGLKDLENKGLVKLPENTRGRVWQDFCLRIYD